MDELAYFHQMDIATLLHVVLFMMLWVGGMVAIDYWVGAPRTFPWGRGQPLPKPPLAAHRRWAKARSSLQNIAVAPGADPTEDDNFVRIKKCQQSGRCLRLQVELE
jgi:hypothetical protein